MKKIITILLLSGLTLTTARAQDAGATHWKTWFISSAKDYRLTPPADYRSETGEIIEQQKQLDATQLQQIRFWNAGSPGYRWQELMSKLWVMDTGSNGALANMLLAVAIYDATLAAWDNKYAYNRPRPYAADKRIKLLAVKTETPSFPCEHSVAAGVAATIIGTFYPAMADSAKKLAAQQMRSRVLAGIAYPSDTQAGFELGRRIALQEIEMTRGYTGRARWDGKIPVHPTAWHGKNPLLPAAGSNKTVVLESASQLRPGPPPDFEQQMNELRKHKPSFRSMSNAFLFASQPVFEDLLTKKIFEYNFHLEPLQAARIYAAVAVGAYDGFTSCWDAKYAYWGTRPDMYDTTFHPVLFQSPPFPGYPSGHAMLSAVNAEIYSYFFPADSALFRKKAKDCAESRFQGGIHFRIDNEVALDMGTKLGKMVVARLREMAEGVNEK